MQPETTALTGSEDLLTVRHLRAGGTQREIGRAYRAVFGKYFPAITLVEVRSLYDDQALVEIEGIAVLPEPPA